ncbi:hypothetical protein [Blastococcus sp. PRF04-17]|uniref:hypothetical protein n=1 Tax=Blastococcus sp. PRF04-17 TaxID=2933797 RepID=UPI001FF6235D|nr:hypothetical protein [Blastococcus sp. PRF04-17]UOY03165.1 hypothetical protein MVA48_07410 [Blastococcus sp. PRF04-17]
MVKAAIEGLTLSLRREVTPFGITAMTVEAGVRTDLAGRSLVQPETPIADYVETAGKRRKEHRAGHGMQPGYPARAAAALIDALRRLSTPGRTAAAASTSPTDHLSGSQNGAAVVGRGAPCARLGDELTTINQP